MRSGKSDLMEAEERSSLTVENQIALSLALDSFTSKLVFKQQSMPQKIGLLDLETGNISYIDGSGSEISLSPDGRFLSLLDDGSGKLTIINLAK